MTSTETTKRLDPRAARTHERALEAARRLFAESGWEGVTIRGIERSTGISRGAIYKQFVSREALCSEVRNGLALDLNDAERQVFADFAPPDGSLEASVFGAVRALIKVASEHGAMLPILSAPSSPDDPSANVLFLRFERALKPVRYLIARSDADAAIGFCFRIVFESTAFAMNSAKVVPPELRRRPEDYSRQLAQMVYLYLATPSNDGEN